MVRERREVKQLHDMKTFFPHDPKSLSREERMKVKALPAGVKNLAALKPTLKKSILANNVE